MAFGLDLFAHHLGFSPNWLNVFHSGVEGETSYTDAVEIHSGVEGATSWTLTLFAAGSGGSSWTLQLFAAGSGGSTWTVPIFNYLFAPNIGVEVATQILQQAPLGVEVATQILQSTGIGYEINTNFRSGPEIGYELATPVLQSRGIGVELATEIEQLTPDGTEPPPIVDPDPCGAGHVPITVCEPRQMVIGPQIDTQWVSQINISERINQGWTWSITYEEDIDLATLDCEAIFQIKLNDFNGALDSPPLIATSRQKTDNGCNTVTLSGIDEPSYRLGNKGQSLGSFFNTTSGEISSAIAGASGVTQSGLEIFPITEEEIQNDSYLSALKRLGAVAGQDYKVLRNGSLQFFPADSIGGAWSGCAIEHGWAHDLASKVTALRVEKQSRIPGGPQCYEFTEAGYFTVALDQPLSRGTAFYRDFSTSGFIDLVSFWSGAPGSPGSNCLRFFSPRNLAPVPPECTFFGDVTHVAFAVFPPDPTRIFGQVVIEDVFARFCIFGTPAGEMVIGQVELQKSFSTLCEDLGFGTTRPAEQVWSEPMIPTLAYAQSKCGLYLRQRRRGWRPIQINAQLELGTACTQAIPPRGNIPAGRILGYRHAVSHGQATTTIEGEPQ